MSKELRIVTIEELKAQMRVDFDEEDELIKAYGCAAEDAVIDATRRTIGDLCANEAIDIAGFPPEEGESLVWFPSRLRIAILMLAAHFYRNREPVASIAQNVVPYSVDVLVKPYVKLKD